MGFLPARKCFAVQDMARYLEHCQLRRAVFKMEDMIHAMQVPASASRANHGEPDSPTQSCQHRGKSLENWTRLICGAYILLYLPYNCQRVFECVQGLKNAVEFFVIYKKSVLVLSAVSNNASPHLPNSYQKCMRIDFTPSWSCQRTKRQPILPKPCTSRQCQPRSHRYQRS